MKLKLRLCISAIIVFSIAVVLFTTRSVPSTQLWKGYRVLFVTGSGVESSDILSVLKNNGCTGIICKESQQLPVVSPFAPVQPQQPVSYITERNAFFTDKSGTATVLYIPDHQEKMINASVKALNSQSGVTAGTDGVGSFPWTTPAVLTVFFLICLFLCSDRSFFVLCSIFPLMFAWCNPFFTVAASSCFCIAGFHLVKKVWGRRDFVFTALSSPFLIILFIFPAGMLLASSPFRAFLYGISCTGSFLLLYLHTVTPGIKANGIETFSPVPILSARAVKKTEKQELRIFVYAGATIAVLLVLSLISISLAGERTTASDAIPQLPTPVRHASSAELPDMEQFTAWGWNTLTFPYRKLDAVSEKPEEKMVISIPEYTQEKDGIIQHESVEFVYNDSFRNSLYHMVQNLDYPALEQLLLRQGKKAQFAYTRNTGAPAERFSSLILMLFALMPFLMTGYCLVVRKK